MKLIKYIACSVCDPYIQIFINCILILCLPVFLVGCGDQVHLPSEAELSEFNHAGPVCPSLDIEQLAKAKIKSGPYCVVPGDVLELTMPAIVRFVSAEEAGSLDTIVPYLSRVNESGTMALPIIGEIKVAGKTLSQIELSVIDAYYPAYVVTRPSVFARVLEYQTAKVSISGAVDRPGIYSLRSDQMSLIALLMEAGGIVDEGAMVIRIVHRDPVVLDDGRSSSSDFDEALLITPAEEDKIRGNKLTNINFADSGSGSHPHKRIGRGGFISPPKSNFSDFESKQDIWLPVHPKSYPDPLSDRLISSVDGNRYRKKDVFENDHRVQGDIDELFDQKALAVLDRGRGPQSERITELGGTQSSKSFVLPIKGLNIPFTDVVLQDGDSVIVERLQPPLFSVVGLVNNAGNFPYPPDTQYNLMQALAFAGGLDRSTEPRYATIYRLKPDKTIVSAVFEVINVKNSSQLTKALNTQIKAGDIIAVEHTPRTRTKLFLDTVFRINIGTYWRLNDAWEE